MITFYPLTQCIGALVVEHEDLFLADGMKQPAYYDRCADIAYWLAQGATRQLEGINATLRSLPVCTECGMAVNKYIMCDEEFGKQWCQDCWDTEAPCERGGHHAEGCSTFVMVGDRQ